MVMEISGAATSSVADGSVNNASGASVGHILQREPVHHECQRRPDLRHGHVGRRDRLDSRVGLHDTEQHPDHGRQRVQRSPGHAIPGRFVRSGERDNLDDLSIIELERQYLCGIQGRADHHWLVAHVGGRGRVGNDHRDKLRIDPGRQHGGFQRDGSDIDKLERTSIVAQVPTGASTGNVVVTVSGVASNGVNFAVLPPPSITSLSPTSGAWGASVTITGTSFGPTVVSSIVAFNGTRATTTSWSDTSIAVPVPSGATSGNVVVIVGGVVSNGVYFTVTTPPLVSLGSAHK